MYLDPDTEMEDALLDGEGQTFVQCGQWWRSKPAPSNMLAFIYAERPPASGTGDGADPIGSLPQGHQFEVLDVFVSECWVSVRFEDTNLEGPTTGWVNVWKRGIEGDSRGDDIGLMCCYPQGYKVPQRPYEGDGEEPDAGDGDNGGEGGKGEGGKGDGGNRGWGGGNGGGSGSNGDGGNGGWGGQGGGWHGGQGGGWHGGRGRWTGGKGSDGGWNGSNGGGKGGKNDGGKSGKDDGGKSGEDDVDGGRSDWGSGSHGGRANGTGHGNGGGRGHGGWGEYGRWNGRNGGHGGLGDGGRGAGGNSNGGGGLGGGWGYDNKGGHGNGGGGGRADGGKGGWGGWGGWVGPPSARAEMYEAARNVRLYEAALRHRRSAAAAASDQGEQAWPSWAAVSAPAGAVQAKANSEGRDVHDQRQRTACWLGVAKMLRQLRQGRSSRTLCTGRLWAIAAPPPRPPVIRARRLGHRGAPCPPPRAPCRPTPTRRDAMCTIKDSAPPVGLALPRCSSR